MKRDIEEVELLLRGALIDLIEWSDDILRLSRVDGSSIRVLRLRRLLDDKVAEILAGLGSAEDNDYRAVSVNNTVVAKNPTKFKTSAIDFPLVTPAQDYPLPAGLNQLMTPVLEQAAAQKMASLLAAAASAQELGDKELSNQLLISAKSTLAVPADTVEYFEPGDMS